MRAILKFEICFMRKNVCSIEKRAYLDILSSGFSSSLEFSTLEFYIKIVSDVAGHYDVGKAKLFGQADVLEEKRILLSYLAQLTV